MHQPLFGKGARALPQRNVDQTNLVPALFSSQALERATLGKMLRLDSRERRKSSGC